MELSLSLVSIIPVIFMLATFTLSILALVFSIKAVRIARGNNKG